MRLRVGRAGGEPMTGTLVFSVDAELAWGSHDLRPLDDAQRRRYRESRENWMELLRLFEAYGVPATWAVVGHLLTDGPEQRDEHPYPDEWFDRADRGMSVRPDEWLGWDLVEAVETATVSNEIASHSFSHAVFSEIPEEVAVAECELVRAVEEEHGFEFSSFVFPRNRIGHRSVLARYGFDCYRGRRPETWPGIPGARGLRMLFGGVTGAVTPPTVTPSIDEHGLVDIPASIFLGGFREQPWSGLTRVGRDPAVTLAKRGIDRACDRGELFHMWLHPHDLTDDRYIRRLRAILDYVSMKENREEARVRTMREVARRVRRGQDVATDRAGRSPLRTNSAGRGSR